MIARIANTLAALLSKPLPPVSAREGVALEELRSTFLNLPVAKTEHLLPSEVVWSDYLNQVRECVLTSDPRTFLRWRPILEMMFTSYAPYLSKELRYLKERPDWEERWRNAIRETYVGHPLPYLLYPASSGTAIHHAFHLASLEEKTGAKVDEFDSVVEFGAGYGSMCRIAFNLGFRGKYICFDLPQSSALQTYYLKSAALSVVSLKELRKVESGIVCISAIEDLRSVVSGLRGRSLFIATWSLSESPVSVRNAIVPLLSSFQSFLLAYYDRFGEVDNDEFFKHLRVTAADVDWQSWPIVHMPRNTYMFGRRTVETSETNQ